MDVLRLTSISRLWSESYDGRAQSNPAIGARVPAGPVHWGSYPGETLEKIMAVLVSQREARALRRTPSAGDGGVDILTESGEGWHVRQVKGFVGRLDGNRRRQIEESLATLRDNPRLTKPVVRWSLTVPIDPTSGEQEWFDSLTADAPFPCDWEGEVHWHKMASDYPQVIDYYLRDGRGRVERRAEVLLDAARAPGGPIAASDVAGHLEALRSALNRDDPHYRYDFSTGPARPEVSKLPDGLVMASAREIQGGGWLTIMVFPRHRYSLVDAPVAGTVQIAVRDEARGIDLRDALDEFRTFGAALDLPPGTLQGSISAPAGLGSDFEGAAGRMGPIEVQEPPARTKLRVDGPEGPVLELGLRTVSATRGELGGIDVATTDDSEVLDVRFRLWPQTEEGSGRLRVTTTLRDISGRPIQSVLPAVRLLAQLRPPNELKWMEDFGIRVFAAHSFQVDSHLLPDGLEQFLENLSLVQNHVRGVVTVPQDISGGVAQAVAESAELLRGGEIRGTWSDVSFQLADHVTPGEFESELSSGGSLVIERDLALEVEGSSYAFGRVQQVAASARLAEVQSEEGTVRLVPGDDLSFVQRLKPVSEE
jgi:hypothetical protein